MTKHVVDTSRRKMLTTSASVVGAVGAAVTLWPFVSTMGPSARALAAGAPVEIEEVELPERGALFAPRSQEGPVEIEDLNATVVGVQRVNLVPHRVDREAGRAALAGE